MALANSSLPVLWGRHQGQGGCCLTELRPCSSRVPAPQPPGGRGRCGPEPAGVLGPSCPRVETRWHFGWWAARVAGWWGLGGLSTARARSGPSRPGHLGRLTTGAVGHGGIRSSTPNPGHSGRALSQVSDVSDPQGPLPAPHTRSLTLWSVTRPWTPPLYLRTLVFPGPFLGALAHQAGYKENDFVVFNCAASL